VLADVARDHAGISIVAATRCGRRDDGDGLAAPEFGFLGDSRRQAGAEPQRRGNKIQQKSRRK
jgi:hypothetical protein